ncbi:uncharacterized protein LOC109405945 [Aedes albopictus]|uniref:CCHC-type domain-containing protein n=1 Tax=Aedes albopictus TaxID=7160 RepID=A0ABM1YBY1_AEDAL
MDPASLLEEEISYELALRHVNNLGALPRRARAVRLRALMQEDEIKGILYDNSSHVMDVGDNISQCQSRVRELIPEVEAALKRGDLPAVRLLRSRLVHYRDRLSIVDPPVAFLDTHAAVALLVQFSLEDVDDALGRTKKSARPVNSDSANRSSTGAVPKGTTQSSTVTEGDFLGFDENGNPVNHSGTSNQASIIHAEQQQRHTASPVTDPIAARPQRDSSTLHDNERGAASLEAMRTTRGRGWSAVGQRVVPNNRFEAQKNSSWREPTMGSTIPPPPYEPIRTEAGEADARGDYNQLRADLLRQLNYRPQEHVPRPLLEERRTLKAIHNWPFRYKGEKDGSSLNTFLQRVEIFAASEGVTEDVLLRNVKHLLLDDALNWYSSVYVSGELVTWDDFKRLIRQEFLPASYAYILRAEAYHRLQGEEEPFSKFYQDISTLFQYVDPPVTDQEKLFIIKKNMNSTYAPIAASHHSIRLLVKAYKELDELRKLQHHQRRISLPYGALIEPALATPNSSLRPSKPQPPLQRFGKVHALETESFHSYGESSSPTAYGAEAEQVAQDEDKMDQRMEALLQQVNALKLRFDRREAVGKQSPNQQFPQMPTSNPNNQRQVPEANNARDPPAAMICWNCDEGGHRFMDCAKPQAVLFCYRCGQKGFSLRSCPTCLQRSGNAQAGSQ